MGLKKVYYGLRIQSIFIIIQAHKKKYDEAAHCITFGKNNITASGGADGVIKLFAPDIWFISSLLSFLSIFWIAIFVNKIAFID